MRPATHLSRWFSLDRATGYAIGARGFAALSGSITVLVIARYFSLEVQGFYYTFASVLTFQTFLELGFGTLIQQFASHEWAHLTLGRNGTISGNDRAHHRLASLTQLALRWYSVAGLLAMVGLGAGGSLYFHTFAQNSGSTTIEWFWPWIGICILTGASLMITPVLSILEGCNQVSRVYGIQLGQGIAGRLISWLTMALGGGLWAPTGGRAAGLATMSLYIRARYGNFFRSLLRMKLPRDAASTSGGKSHRINWRREIWPLQWKFALTWIGGYLLYALFTPVLFAFHGAAVAGQMGMTLALVNLLTSVSYAILSPKIPQLAQHAARKEYGDLDRLFLRVTRSSMLAAGLGAVAIWLVLYTLSQTGTDLAERFLSPTAAGALLVATFVQQLRHAMGAYLRAHKEEPYLKLSLIEGACAAIGLFALGKWYGALGMALGFLAITLMMIGPAVFIFRAKRRAWQLDRGAAQ